MERPDLPLKALPASQSRDFPASVEINLPGRKDALFQA